MGWDNLMEGAGLGWVPVPVPVQFPLEGPGPGDFSGTRYLLRRSVIVDPGLGKRRPKEDREAGRREDGLTMASLQGEKLRERMVIRDNGGIDMMRHNTTQQ
jgi:hypothetical protein